MSTSNKARIMSLLQGNQLAEAKKLCQSFCRKHKMDAEAWFLLGSIHGQSGDLENAADCLSRSASIRNDVAMTHYNLGLVNARLQRYTQARGNLEKALTLEPGLTAARHELANVIHSQGHPGDAIPHYRKALQAEPDALPMLANLSAACTATQDYTGAIEILRHILRLDAGNIEARFNLGNALSAAGEMDAAETAFREVLKRRPGMSNVLNNLGLVLHREGRLDEAITCYQESLAANANQTSAWTNLANGYRDRQEPGLAIDILEKALSRFPDVPVLHGDISLLLLGTEQFARGWDEYEWRYEGQGLARRDFPIPGWDGGTTKDKTILVTAEQGIGDEIMFASCFPDIIKASAHVVLECEPRLAPLFQRSFPGATIQAGKQTPNPDWLSTIPAPDRVVAAGSLPRYFRRETGDFPARSGYLVTDPEKTARWRQRYAGLDKKMTVGISWQGGHISQFARRSTTLADWQAILTIPDIGFVNVQYGEVRPDLERAEELFGTVVHHWDDCDPLTDMDNFAAQLAALDLVISVDNSTVHLAGSLGISTWILQSCIPDWRWTYHSRDSHWYPAIRQFHQSAPSDWSKPIDAVATELKTLLKT